MEERHRIAVFIDFDNIEIGVKNTLGKNFDVSAVLEALKERGEVLSKIAYGDWTYHGETSRILGQHGVQMVQRHPGPRGDKNGADINLALDALEMALTKPHIDAFAIVSGDSDFISLVEKLKQYNKAVFIVGGRAFTSTILQKNCREFISYESLLPSGPTHRGGRGAQRSAKTGSALPLTNATPLMHRALEVLARREVQPQLGLLKSTMLQLDSSFTERDYGASSFQQFVEMLEKARLVKTRRVHGHYLVELPGPEETPLAEVPLLKREDALPVLQKSLKVIDENDLWGQLDFNGVKQYVERLAPDFDEKRYGFGQFAELLNYAQDLGLVRLEPDAEAVLRVFPGRQFRAAHAGFSTVVHPTMVSAESSAFPDGSPAPESEATSLPPAAPAEASLAPKAKRTYRRRSRARSSTSRASQKNPPEKS
ncbi:MAG: NYN domain-containing protein [Acidobacteria bacterium]|nr:NYN domain-containing protein [Acidobacteriota bacterium]